MRYLFIGGAGDGERIETQGEPTYHVARRSSLEEYGSYDQMKEPRYGADNVSHYRSVKFRAGGSFTFIYVDESIYRKAQSQEDLDELALHALIDGYRNPEGEQRRRPPTASQSGMSRGEPSSSKTSSLPAEERDYKDAMRQALKDAMTRTPKWEDPKGLTFMGEPVTMDEVMGLAMKEDCNCVVCIAKREGRAMGDVELAFLATMMQQLEQAVMMDREVQRQLMTKRDVWEMYYGGAEKQRVVTIEEYEQERLPPTEPKLKKMSWRTFDSTAPKSQKGKRHGFR